MPILESGLRCCSFCFASFRVSGRALSLQAHQPFWSKARHEINEVLLGRFEYRLEHRHPDCFDRLARGEHATVRTASNMGMAATILSISVCCNVGLYIRRGVKESPAFSTVAERQSKATLKEIYRGVFGPGRGAFVRCLGLRIGEVGPSMIFQVFLIGYIANLPNASKTTGTLGLVLASVFCYFTIPVVGKLCDRFGRRLVHMSLTGLLILFAVPAFAMVSTGNPILITLSFMLGFGVSIMGMYVIESPWMAEMFGSRYRLAGVTASKEIGSLIGGAFAPFICAALVARYGSWWPVAIYVILLAAISLISAFLSLKPRNAT